MKVAMICGFAWEPKATASARAYPMAEALVSRGHDVILLISPYDNLSYSGKSCEKKGVKIVNLSIQSGSMTKLLRIPFDFLKEVKRFQPDIVHVFKPKGFSGMVGTMLESMGSLPVTVDYDDWEGTGGWNDIVDYPWYVKRFIDWQERSIPKHARSVTVVSSALADRLRRFGIHNKKMFYIPNGLTPELQDFSQLDSAAKTEVRKQLDCGFAPMVIYVGQFEKADEVGIMAEIVKLVLDQTDARFIFVGSGSELQGLIRRTHEYGIADKVRFLGRVPYDELLRLVSTADIAVYPYPDTQIYRCKCSAKIILYLGLGKPVVTGAIGQNLEYMEHMRTGVLVDSTTAKAYAAGLLTLLNDPSLRQKIGVEAQKRTRKEYSWNTTLVTRLEEAYEYALGSSSRDKPSDFANRANSVSLELEEGARINKDTDGILIANQREGRK
jgi:glycosyltransferase involved in cell wall biosynthesis